jgi:hypothetical protein
MAKALEGSVHEDKPGFFDKLCMIAPALGVGGIVIAVIALALDKSLPYRITAENYARYSLVNWLLVVSFTLGIITIFLGIIVRRRLPTAVGICCCAFLFLPLGEGHFRPNSTYWCWCNLQKIKEAKENAEAKRLTTQPILPYGTIITTQEIDNYVPCGFRKLKCLSGGHYTPGGVGVDPKCSFHGSFTEMHTNSFGYWNYLWVIRTGSGGYGIGQNLKGETELFFGTRQIDPRTSVGLSFAALIVPTIVVAGCLIYSVHLLLMKPSKHVVCKAG